MGANVSNLASRAHFMLIFGNCKYRGCALCVFFNSCSIFNDGFKDLRTDLQNKLQQGKGSSLSLNIEQEIVIIMAVNSSTVNDFNTAVRLGTILAGTDQSWSTDSLIAPWSLFPM